MGSIAVHLAVVAAVMLLVAGCARPDWIESTLVTVDVSGEWTGRFVSAEGMIPTRLTLQQTGAKVTGQFSNGGRIEGTVNGDVLRVTWAGYRQFELVVSGDEMHGTADLRHGRAVIDLRRAR